MNPKVMFLHVADRFYLDVVESLSGSLDICAIVTPTGELKSNVLNCSVLDAREFEYPSKIWKINQGLKNPLSEEELRRYAGTERFFLSNSDRFSYTPISAQDRIHLFQELLKYWLNFFKENKVDAIVWDALPHMNWDNIVYDIAKELGIKTIYLERTLVKDRILILGGLNLPDKVKNLDNPPNELYSLAKEESAWAKRSNEVNKGKGVASPITKLKRFSFAKIKDVNFSPTFYNGRQNYFKLLVEKKRNNISIKKAKCAYQSKSQDYTRGKFILFALNYQAERSTSPLAGYFENPLLAIEILSSILPKGWKIYLKEHPRQFMLNELRTKHYRSKELYDKFKSYENVEFLDINADLKSFFARAEFVATVSGSVGWEALMANKCAVVFGNTWYAGCNSCFLINSIETGIDALKKINQKKEQDVEKDVKEFLGHLNNHSVVSATSYEIARQSQIEYTVLVHNLKEALEKELKPKKVKVVLQKEYGKGQFTLSDQNQGMGMSVGLKQVAINLAIADKKLKEEEYKSKH